MIYSDGRDLRYDVMHGLRHLYTIKMMSLRGNDHNPFQQLGIIHDDPKTIFRTERIHMHTNATRIIVNHFILT